MFSNKKTKPLPEPEKFPPQIIEALKNINFKLDVLIKKDEKVHKQLNDELKNE